MTHFGKLVNPSILKWVSSYFIENQLKMDFLHIPKMQSPRLYGTKRLLATELYRVNECERVPRVILKEAQAALLEYLHYTRSIEFLDAENMSKNSPHFLRKLLKRVEIVEGVGKSMSRFFRYHPINEFEPFFESLGLKPCEYTPLLPRDLMFLCDDCLLLENCKVLCAVGIARNKIGRIYKKEVQVFRLESGVLSLKIQAYQDLGLSKSFIAKVIVCSPRVLIGDEDMKFIMVLENLKSEGFDYAWIKKNLSEKESYDWSVMFRVLNFFREMYCSSELHKLISQHPRLLFERSGDGVFPIIAIMLKFGLPMDQILLIFLHFPDIPVSQFVSNHIRCITFFHEIEMEVDAIGNIVCSYPILLGSCTLKKTDSLLNLLNVGKRRLCKYIQENPQELSKWGMGKRVQQLPASGEDEESEKLKMKFFLDLGYGENPNMMKKAFKVFRGRGGELQERFDAIVNAGLDKNDVSNMVRVSPQILNQTKTLIQSKIDILVNELGFPISTLILFPSYLSYKTQRVRLRLAVYNWLKDQEMVEPGLALSTIIACTDKLFLGQYVKKHTSGLKDMGNNEQLPSQEELRSLLDPLAKSQLVDLLSKLGSQFPSVAEEIKGIASSDPVHRKLFVRGLAWNTTPETLCAGRMAVCNLACEGLSGASSTPDLSQRKLYIGGLSPDVTSEMLLNYFARHGEIGEGSVAYDKDTNESRGFGFVTYKTAEEAKKAIDDPQKNLGGRTLIVKLADTHKGKPVQAQTPAAAVVPLALPMAPGYPQLGKAHPTAAPVGYGYPQHVASYQASSYSYSRPAVAPAPAPAPAPYPNQLPRPYAPITPMGMGGYPYCIGKQ